MSVIYLLLRVVLLAAVVWTRGRIAPWLVGVHYFGLDTFSIITSFSTSVACENIRFSSLFTVGDIKSVRTNLYLEPHDYRIYYVKIDLHHQYGISVRWVADVPLRETSPAAKSEEKRMFSQAPCNRRYVFINV